MTDPLYEQLMNRLTGRNQSLEEIGDLLYGMVDPRIQKRRETKGFKSSSIDKLEEDFIRQGILTRQINLRDGSWVRYTIGRVLAFTKKDDTPVLLTPGFRTFSFVDPYTNQKVKIGKNYKQYADFFKPEAFTLSYPLPSSSLKLKDIGKLALASLNKVEMLFIFTACVGVMLLEMVTPFLNKIIFSEIVPSNDSNELYPVSVILFSACLALVILTATRSLVAFRLKDKVEYELQNGLMARLFNLPSEVFKTYSSGELAERVLAVSSFSAQITDEMLCAILSLLVSGLLGFQLFIFGGELLWLAAILLILMLVGIVLGFYYNYKARTQTIPYNAKIQGMLFSLFSGIQKIKVCSAEIYALRKWAEVYCKSDYLCTQYNFRRIFYTITTYIYYYAVPFVIMIAAFKASLSLADYIAFAAVLAIALKTVDSMKGVMSAVSTAAPILQLATPILQQQPNKSDASAIVNDVTGAIEIHDVCFSYPDNDRVIFDRLNLRIKPGEYVAIVGKSGCGKTTLLRLLLGFETPTAGSIFYDHYNLADINKSSLRHNCISISLQNGRIINGTVMENICFTRLEATEEEAWETAKLAALDEDIRHMKDGIHTMLGENGQEVSGGQRQRILIARALISRPKILLLDEATSALDNISQKVVSDNLKRIGCTRITIAHRLSTIRECDRILVLDNGHIAENGTYDELVAKGGIFSELCKQQIQNAFWNGKK